MPADKETIRDRNDIVDVVSASVALKRRGKSYVGLCPFHNEKTPSFSVDPSFQTFTCFGCGAKGDVFNFVEQYHNMSFVEAAEFLARRVGLVFERKGGQTTGQEISEREKLFAMNSLAAKFYRDMLERVAFAKQYVLDRGLTYETIKKFGIGYAPNDWESLVGHLESRKQDLELAERAGLVKKRESGGCFDMFRNRILFPIHDEQERIVGFGGRAFEDDTPKYLNTGDTPIFSKSKLLYGLPFARRKIASEGRALLMEGYMDVIAAHQAGFENAVATLGTSLTEDHARKLSRLVPENPLVVLIYDADAAGIKATLRGSEILEKEGVEVRAARLPAGDDPDSLLKRGESAAFLHAIDNAASRVNYLIQYALSRHDVAKPEGRDAFLRDLYRILLAIKQTSMVDAQLVKFAHLHPFAAHGLPTAVDRMRQELEQRRLGKPKGKPIDDSPKADLTAQLAQRESALGMLQAIAGDERRLKRSAEVSPEKQAILSEMKRSRFGPPPKVVPVTSGTGGLSAEDRAERELIRALGEPDWRQSVLNQTTREDFVSPLGRTFRELIEENQADLGGGGDDLITVLDRHEDREISVAIRALLQEINATMEKVPVNEAAIAGCVRTLQLHRKEREMREQAQLLQKKSVLAADDREFVREYQRILRELKGSKGTQISEG